MEPIKVLIADDHPVVREGLRALISAQSDMRVVGEAVDGLDAVSKVGKLGPDVVLLDLAMPRMDGITAIPEILGGYPDARILVVTTYADDDKIVTAIKRGALGYLLKDASPRELLEAIRHVRNGNAPLPPAIARKLLNELNRPVSAPVDREEPLSEREVEVLILLAKGLSNREIADSLVVSERTVHAHVSHILHKLDLNSRVQAALYALREGLVELSSAA
jgi:NarL family two-component system response regulator LiaR